MHFNRETRWAVCGDLARYDSCQKPWKSGRVAGHDLRERGKGSGVFGVDLAPDDRRGKAGGGG